MKSAAKTSMETISKGWSAATDLFTHVSLYAFQISNCTRESHNSDILERTTAIYHSRGPRELEYYSLLMIMPNFSLLPSTSPHVTAGVADVQVSKTQPQQRANQSDDV